MKDRTFFNKEVTCPVCGEEFEVQKVRTPAIQVEKQDTDFCLHYRSVNPLAYAIWVCPKCLYSGEESDFDSLPRFKEVKLKGHIYSIFKKYGTPDLSDERSSEKAILSYEIAMDWAKFFEKSSFRLASFSLRIGWLYRFSGEDQKENEFIDKAVKLYRKGFETEHNIPKNLGEVGAIYLIGELYRRLGNKNDALKWFGKALSHPDLRSNPKIERLCRDQWQETKNKAVDELEEIVELG